MEGFFSFRTHHWLNFRQKGSDVVAHCAKSFFRAPANLVDNCARRRATRAEGTATASAAAASSAAAVAAMVP